MKTIFKKNTIKIFALTAALFFALYAHIGFALAPTDNVASLGTIKPLLHSGAGEQARESLFLIESQGPMSAVFEALSTIGRPSFFEAPSAPQSSNNKTTSTTSITAFISSLGDVWIGGNLFVGLSKNDFNPIFQANQDFVLENNEDNQTIGWKWLNNFGGAFSGFSATLQKINVDGNVLASSLAHDATVPDTVCIDSKGTLVSCGTFSCTGTAPADASMCANDNTGLTADTPNTLVASCTTSTKCEFTCSSGYHYDNATNSCM